MLHSDKPVRVFITHVEHLLQLPEEHQELLLVRHGLHAGELERNLHQRRRRSVQPRAPRAAPGAAGHEPLLPTPLSPVTRSNRVSDPKESNRFSFDSLQTELKHNLLQNVMNNKRIIENYKY